jgi:hypothetical protein
MLNNTLSQTLRNDYLEYIKRSAELGWSEYPKVIDQWKKKIEPSILWGYDAPSQPIYLADVLGFLYHETADPTYAEKARDILVSYGDLRDAYPKDYWKTRAEYANGIPAIPNFFFLPGYSRTYIRIRNSGVLDRASIEIIERDLALSLDFVFFFPEWGAMNRAMLRAESLYYGATALSHHPSSNKWFQIAKTLASDNLNQWEVEDATVYHPVWLYSLFSYIDISGKHEVFDSPIIKYYMDYYLNLLAPHGNIADFGDANWNSGWDRFVPVFEKAATIYRNPYYKFLAHELLNSAIERQRRNRDENSIKDLNKSYNMLWAEAAVASCLTDAYRWSDDSIVPEKPNWLSREVLEDVVGKKVVFRNGWDKKSTFLLLNYRDEGDGGLLHRDYLRNTLSVEEEKMHHGHSDENSICLLMSGGSVMLHDGGYRDGLPSGQWGAYRADYYHNRVVARRDKRDVKQELFDFLRNSGAYRKVMTQKIDFLSFRDTDMSRTRLVDAELGYQWDRVVTFVKRKNLFVVFDGIQFLRSDYYTLANLWHTRKIVGKGEKHFETIIDTIGDDRLSGDRSLLLYFPETYAKEIGSYPERRHYQEETAIYQCIASHYLRGHFECFVTILVPHKIGEDSENIIQQFNLIKTDKFPQAVGIIVKDGKEESCICVKFDLEMDLARENIRPRYRYDLGKVKYLDFETDAHFLSAVVSEKKVQYSASNMLKVLYRGHTLMEALPNTHGLQLDGMPDREGYTKWRFWEDELELES